MAPILVFDFETDGLTMHPDAPLEMQPRAIEFGAVYLDPQTGDELASFEWLINPEREISPTITKITGITNDMLRDAPPLSAQWMRIDDVVKGASVAVAHNLPFDKAILKYELERMGLDPKFMQLPARQFCTLELYRQSWGKDMKLTALYEVIVGKKLDQKHRGLSDVRALVDIIRGDKLLDIMR